MDPGKGGEDPARLFAFVRPEEPQTEHKRGKDNAAAPAADDDAALSPQPPPPSNSAAAKRPLSSSPSPLRHGGKMARVNPGDVSFAAGDAPAAAAAAAVPPPAAGSSSSAWCGQFEDINRRIKAAR